MKLILFVWLLVGSALAQDNANVPQTVSAVVETGPEHKIVEETISIGTDVDRKTTHKPTSSSTTAPTTSSSTTAMPITSSSSPPSSSTNPPTSSSSAPTTSPAPPTTSPAPPSPTSPSTTPVPPAPPKTPIWNVTDTNITCILAKMNISLVFRYENKTESMQINPGTASASGKCAVANQTLNITWLHNNHTASLIFEFNQTSTKYYVSSLALHVFVNISKGEMLNATAKHLSLETAKHSSYSCPSYELKMKPDNKAYENVTIDMNMNDILVEAYRSSNTTNFASAHQCISGEVPDIVPLIVGLGLAGLVLVVVIAFFVGRRRSQARGYLSM